MVPDVRIQPGWCASAAQVQQELERSDALVCLTQQCPQLASAGMLTLGHGQPRRWDTAGAAAVAAKRPFGLWRVTLPPVNGLSLPAMLPAPHPQMRVDEPVQAWLTDRGPRRPGQGCPRRRRRTVRRAARRRRGDCVAPAGPHPGSLGEVAARGPGNIRRRSAAAGLGGIRRSVDYLAALADPHTWTEEAWRHHFQPAWAAVIAAHVRFRGRRAAMRISREYRVWPVYAHDAAMIYTPGRDEATGAPIDSSDRHSRLGRLVMSRCAPLTDKTVLAVILAQSTTEVAQALTAALGVSADPSDSDSATAAQRGGPAAAQTADTGQTDDQTSPTDAAAAVQAPPAPIADQHEAPTKNARPRRTTGAAKVACGGAPAAVLHTDGLWLTDGTRVALTDPITHVGQVAELAYTHHIGYRLTPKFCEPGQIWITEQACRAFGIDVEAISRRDRQVAAPTHRRYRLRHPRRQRGMESRRRGGGPQRPPARDMDPRLPRRQTRRDDRTHPRHGRRTR